STAKEMQRPHRVGPDRDHRRSGILPRRPLSLGAEHRPFRHRGLETRVGTRGRERPRNRGDVGLAGDGIDLIFRQVRLIIIVPAGRTVTSVPTFALIWSRRSAKAWSTVTMIRARLIPTARIATIKPARSGLRATLRRARITVRLA